MSGYDSLKKVTVINHDISKLLILILHTNIGRFSRRSKPLRRLSAMHMDPYSHIMIKPALNFKYAFDAMLFSIDSNC